MSNAENIQNFIASTKEGKFFTYIVNLYLNFIQ